MVCFDLNRGANWKFIHCIAVNDWL